MSSLRITSRLITLGPQTASRSTLSSIGRRNFTTSVLRMAPSQEWMIIVPDKPGMLETRMKIRPDHLAALKPNVDSGFVVMGGASLDEPIKEGQGPKANGSILLAVAETKEEVIEKLNKDPYVAAGVWDLSRVSAATSIMQREVFFTDALHDRQDGYNPSDITTDIFNIGPDYTLQECGTASYVGHGILF
nr:fusaric acid biosynthesis protein 2 [Quercus suber]